MTLRVLTLGTFDGVHLGHQAIVRTARQLADAHNGPSEVVAVTFTRHPASTLRPGTEPMRLCDTATQVQRLERAGVDRVELLEPTPDLLGLTPQAFVEKLVHEFAPAHMVEGPDFHFGKARAGDNALLATLGKTHGFEVHVLSRLNVTLHNLHETPVSSSLIRWLIAHGRVEDAHRCLGTPQTFSATVVRGDRKGRELGFPTTNLDIDELVGYQLPRPGVYAGLASVPDGRTWPAAISLGHKPTFKEKPLTLEAHLLDTLKDPNALDLYGQRITLAFTHWLRDQQAYPSLDALIHQLHADVADTRRLVTVPAE